MSATLLIPVLNERPGLEKILPELDPRWVDEILFVDGGSTDGTVELLQKWGKGRVIHQTKPGLSMAYWEAFPSIRSDVILTFSPDGNSLSSAIPSLLTKMGEGYDMVIASRYLKGAGSQDDGPITSLGNWMFTRVINLLFGGRYTDTLVILRAYRSSLIKDLAIDATEPVFEPQLSIRCAVHGRKVAEIPAKEPPRIGGERKMRIFYNGWAIVKLIWREHLRARELSKKNGHT